MNWSEIDGSYTTTHGEFGVTINPSDIMGWIWVLWLGDEEVDQGHNYTVQDAQEDAEAEMQEFMDELFQQMTASLTLE